MAWPPPLMPINRTDATPQQVDHPADHNTIAQAFNDLVPIIAALQDRYLIAAGTIGGAGAPAGPFINGTFELGRIVLPTVAFPTTVLAMVAHSSAFDAGTPATFTADIQSLATTGTAGLGRSDPTVAGKYVGATLFAAYPVAAGAGGGFAARMSIVGLGAGNAGYSFWSAAYLQFAAD
jgi:hypothetical protein